MSPGERMLTFTVPPSRNCLNSTEIATPWTSPSTITIVRTSSWSTWSPDSVSGVTVAQARRPPHSKWAP